jgi:dethiobiotin synthetase
MNTSNRKPFSFDVSAWPKLPRARGVFVTATDTGVGKTVIAGAIADYLRTAGKTVEVFKPVATGCRRGGGGLLLNEDAEFLAACADSTRLLEEINPVRYSQPLAPNVAAGRSGRPIDTGKIFEAYGELARTNRPVVVEGVGGLLCPITDDLWVIHLAGMMNLPVVIVARAGLGTINHTLLTLHAARSAGRTVVGVIITREPVAPGKPDIATETNPAQIAQRGNVRILTIVGEDPGTCVAKAALGKDTKFAVSQVDWEGIIR